MRCYMKTTKLTHMISNQRPATATKFRGAIWTRRLNRAKIDVKMRSNGVQILIGLCFDCVHILCHTHFTLISAIYWNALRSRVISHKIEK